MKKTSWILTSEHNQYDQYGEYFICWFSDKPGQEELKPIVKEFADTSPADSLEDYVNFVLEGGGRMKFEEVWLHLRQVQECETYPECS